MRSPRPEPQLPHFNPSFFAVQARRNQPNIRPIWLKRQLKNAFQAGFFSATVVYAVATITAYLIINS